MSRLGNKKPGRYFIDLPDELKDRELIIQIILKGKIEKKDTTTELPENRLAKVRYFAGIASEATIAADEEDMTAQ
jgi:hypothetical protein